MLELTAEAISDLSIFRTTKRFYLRDIGKLSKSELHQWHSAEDYQLKSTFCYRSPCVLESFQNKPFKCISNINAISDIYVCACFYHLL